jgi:hypothetical protein
MLGQAAQAHAEQDGGRAGQQEGERQGQQRTQRRHRAALHRSDQGVDHGELGRIRFGTHRAEQGAPVHRAHHGADQQFPGHAPGLGIRHWRPAVMLPDHPMDVGGDRQLHQTPQVERRHVGRWRQREPHQHDDQQRHPGRAADVVDHEPHLLRQHARLVQPQQHAEVAHQQAIPRRDKAG